MPDDDTDEAVDAAAEKLYAAAPDDFMSLRAELAKAADAAVGKAIAKLRKPTAPASVVNRYVHHDPDVVARLSDLGDRLRRATRDLDATTLRELSTERRKLVADTTKAAFGHAGNPTPSAAQRDDVSATFDAAVADPDVANRLGRLVRPESFSGFGVAPGPELTLVRGAMKPTKPTKKAPAKKRPPARTTTKAREAFTRADDDYTATRNAEREAQDRITTITADLTRLQQELVDAKRDLDRARKDVRAAKTERRKAQTALDRAERDYEG